MLYDEQRLLRRLQDHGCPMLDSGVSTQDERRSRIAEAIKQRQLENIVLGRGRDEKPMTYAQAFTNLYGVKP